MKGNKCPICGTSCGAMASGAMRDSFICDACYRHICDGCCRGYSIPDEFHPEIERAHGVGMLLLCEDCADSLIFGFPSKGPKR